MSKVEELAKSFREDPDNRLLQTKLYSVITNYKGMVYNYAYKYSTFNKSDVDTIINDVYLRIQNKIHKWEPSMCQFKTWLYSCIINEVRVYYYKQNKHYNRFVNTSTITDNTTLNPLNIAKSSTDSYIADVDISTGVAFYDYNNKNHKFGWNILVAGKIVNFAKRLHVLSSNVRIGKKIDKHTINLRTKFSPSKTVNVYECFLLNDNYKEKIEFNTYDEYKNFQLNNNKEKLNSILPTTIPEKYLDIMNDYITRKYTYKDLMTKYGIEMHTVKNIIHFNKKKIKETLNYD